MVSNVVEKTVKNFFLQFYGFSADDNRRIRIGNSTILPDLIINFGNNPFAVIEFKSHFSSEEKNYVSSQLMTYIEPLRKWNESVKLYILCVKGVYWILNVHSGELITFPPIELLEHIACFINDEAKIVNDGLRKELCRQIESHQWGDFGKTLIKHVKDGKLKAFGDNMFLDDKDEISFMQDLLTGGKKLPSDICRYTSAKTIFDTLDNGKFWMFGPEAMNDKTETKVIEDYAELRDAKHSVTDFIYDGFIMSFSELSRFDKLFSWYMYGDKTKGVCISANIKEGYNKNEFLIAPIAYINPNEKDASVNMLQFLNELMQMNIGGTKFILRLWHYWKYFFKYNYYEEEREVRLLHIKKDKGNWKWDKYHNQPVRYVEIPIDNMPFSISKLVLGPQCVSDGLARMERCKFPVVPSAIHGFKG